MLKESAKKKHLSFHTPGHKIGRWDITELSYSASLTSPTGCIARAEEDITRILGAKGSFILTDGSTSGVHAMLYAFKRLGGRRLLIFENAHLSVYTGLSLLGLEYILAPVGEYARLAEADGVMVTSPDYYGSLPDLSLLRERCNGEGKLLLIDGAHGGHLRGTPLYAGNYADLWVDGVHKSLPALTQGAVVSAKKEDYVEPLREGAECFRTTSPSYPIMASVEYAVKYPRKEKLEALVRETFIGERLSVGKDWTKVSALFGKAAFDAQAALERKGIYPEFCDGSLLLFYLSPATSARAVKKLKRVLDGLLEKYPYEAEETVQRNHTPLLLPANGKKEWVKIEEAEGRICARACGLFPPCVPLLFEGERIDREKIRLLSSANNVFGLQDKKISVYEEEK